MSTFRARSIRCHANHPFEGELFDSLHVSRRPDVREQILDGTFHRFTCPTCAEPVVVEHRLAYTDFPRRQWFTVFPRIDLRHCEEMVAFAQRSFQATMVERAPEMVRDWARDMTTRAIFGLASLREKLLVFEAGLDDRVVECLKLQLFRAAGLELHPDTFLHVATVETDTLVLSYGPPGRPPANLPVPRELYAMLELDSERLRGGLPWLFDDIVVDYRSIMGPRGTLVPIQVA